MLKRVGESQADPENTRKAIVEHCRAYRISERTFWYYPVCYEQHHTFNLDEQPDAPFGACDEYLRQQIRHRNLAQVKNLLDFTSSSVDRMNDLFDWLLSSLLETARNQNPSSVGDEMLPDEELFFLCERIIINAIAVMQRSFQQATWTPALEAEKDITLRESPLSLAKKSKR